MPNPAGRVVALVKIARRIAGTAAVAGCALGFASGARAILFTETGDPAYNTAAPTGPLADSGWQWQGRWGSFLGTPIHAKYFLTARHVGGGIGGALQLDGQSYVTTAFTDVPGCDLRLWRICGEFADYAPLHANGVAVGRTLVWFGRGTQRGAEVYRTNNLAAELRGWRWGVSDGLLRWGQNRVEDVYTSGSAGPLLRATFDADGGANECHLSTGDSGGAAFVREGNRWELAGIHYSVDGPYRYPEGGLPFDAALFNHQGFYGLDAGEWVPVTEGDQPEAGSLYATDVSAHAAWILDFVNRAASTDDTPTLQCSDRITGGYTDASNVQVDAVGRTLRVTFSGQAEFYRLRGCAPSRITRVVREEDQLVFGYE